MMTTEMDLSGDAQKIQTVMDLPPFVVIHVEASRRRDGLLRAHSPIVALSNAGIQGDDEFPFRAAEALQMDDLPHGEGAYTFLLWLEWYRHEYPVFHKGEWRCSRRELLKYAPHGTEDPDLDVPF